MLGGTWFRKPWWRRLSSRFKTGDMNLKPGQGQRAPAHCSPYSQICKLGGWIRLRLRTLLAVRYKSPLAVSSFFLHWWPPSLGWWVPGEKDLYIKMCLPQIGTLRANFKVVFRWIQGGAVSGRKCTLLKYVRNPVQKIKQWGNREVATPPRAQSWEQTLCQEDLQVLQPLNLPEVLLRLRFDSASV